MFEGISVCTQASVLYIQGKWFLFTKVGDAIKNCHFM